MIGIIVTVSIVALIVIIMFFSSICLVNQSTTVIIQRLGKYHRTLAAGLHFIIPIVESRHKKISQKEIVADFPPQPVITKDNVTMQIDTVVYYQITDSKLYTYGIENPISAIENLTATTLRNLIGDLELDQTLTSRDTINTQMRVILDEATDPWGIKINRVELKNILPPREIQVAMEKQMRAEREKRESILVADGQKLAKILTAEGDKQSRILEAEGKKIALIAEAEGEAEALIKLYTARAESITLINNAAPNQAYITLKGYEALEKVANGKSTKLIIPSDLTGIASITSTIKEVLDIKKPTK